MKQKRGFNNFKKNNKKLSCLVIAILISLSFSTALGNKVNSDNYNKHNTLSLNYKFSFNRPKLQELNMYGESFTKISMPGTFSIGQDSGMPVFQTKTIQILLPQETKIKDINVLVKEKIEVDVGSMGFNLHQKPIFPYQREIPFSEPIPNSLTINQDAYLSKEKFPTKKYVNHGVEYCRGYSILSIDLRPTQYIPSEGKLFYYPNMTIELNLEEKGEKHRFYRNNPNDKEWVKNLVMNPEVIDSYDDRDLDNSYYEGGICDPDEDFDYVIIVRERLYDFSGTTYNWDDFINRKEKAGLKTTKIKVEDINACNDYHNSDSPVNDQQARIREFCRDAYQDWGTEYILIAGDHEGISAIPRRLMKYEHEGNVESDIYWSNLDKTFNDDGDGYWGEEGDSGFDLYSELFIGSIPCDEGIDLSNWMTKSFYYEDSKDKNYLNNLAFYAGDSGWNAQGDDFMDFTFYGTDNWLGPNPGAHGSYPEWLGFLFGFDTWNNIHSDKKFDTDKKWTAEPPNPGWNGGSESSARESLKNAINNDEITILLGLAHANSEHSLDTPINRAADKHSHGEPYWDDHFHNTKPFFIYDYGCHCGDMSASDDGVLGSMLFNDDKKLAFGCVYNTCYGWGSYHDTNSSSALQQKLFWDYILDLENNSHSESNWQLGKAMAYSKDTMAPTIDWTYSRAPGSWRGIIQGCLLFADPALTINIGGPELSFEPTSHDFGQMYKAERDSTIFEIWNNNKETLTYTLSESCNWVSVSPKKGNSSSGEKDTITIEVDTNNLDCGLHNCSINIESNGGNGVFDLSVNVVSRPPDEPVNPMPNNNDKGIGINPTLSVDVSDVDNDIMKVIFYDANGDKEIGIENNVQSGGTASITWNNLEYGTKYSWYAVADDGVFETQSEIFSFTTNSPPIFTNINPKNGSTDVPLNLEYLSADIIDPDGDNFDWSITTIPDIGKNNKINELDGTKLCNITDLKPLTEYIWTIEAFDGKGKTKKAIYQFKTKENIPPLEPIENSPKNNVENTSIICILNWSCTDPDEYKDGLQYNVYFGKNPNPKLIKEKIPETSFKIPYDLEINTVYYWKVEAKDRFGEITESKTWKFKTSSLPPPPENLSISFPKKICWAGVKINILNDDIRDASNIKWELSAKGGLFNRINMTKEGCIKRLNSSETKEISTYRPLELKTRIIGFGKITIGVTAKKRNGEIVSFQSIEGRVLGTIVRLFLN